MIIVDIEKYLVTSYKGQIGLGRVAAHLMEVLPDGWDRQSRITITHDGNATDADGAVIFTLTPDDAEALCTSIDDAAAKEKSARMAAVHMAEAVTVPQAVVLALLTDPVSSHDLAAIKTAVNQAITDGKTGFHDLLAASLASLNGG
jgi:hypothetical protein